MQLKTESKSSEFSDKARKDNESANIAVGLDIGTTKICALVASCGAREDSLDILGIGIAENEGLNRGVVVNIEKTVKSLKNVIEQAEQQSGITIKECIVGIAGDHVESFQTRGIVGISSPTHEITQKDVDRLLEETRKLNIPSERKIVHVIPQDFIIDGQDGITDPVGMNGVRMEANVHIVTAQATAIQNIHKCVNRLDIAVKDIVLEPIASSIAVLSEEEKEVGVALIDIGGGTTDIAIFEENILRFTSVIGIGGRQVTSDIRQIMGIIASQAERIKRDYGHASKSTIFQDEIFMIPGIGGRKPVERTKSELCDIIQPRMEEIYEFALAEIRRSGFSGRLGAGIVLTGGAALMRGADELAQDVFGMPVKIGIPSGITYSGLAPEIESPIYSTGVGLVMYGLNNYPVVIKREVDEKKPQEQGGKVDEEPAVTEAKPMQSKNSIFKRMKNFMNDL